VSGRPAAAALMALGAALAVLPAFAWYSAPRAAGAVTATGYAGAGQLLLLPLLGGLAVLAGATLVSARADGRPDTATWAGAVAVVSGLIALGFTIWAAAAPRVELTVVLADGTEVVPSAVDLEPAAVIAPVLAGALVLLGVAVARSGRRR
jgi:hypothetical protein